MSENILHMGLCLPKSCSNSDIHDLVQTLLDQKRFTFDLGLQPNVLEVKNLKFNPQIFLNRSFLILVACFVLLRFLNQSAAKLEKSIKIDENNNIALGMENEIQLSFCDKLIKCFNYDFNKRSIRSRDAPKSAVNSISGMR